MNKKLYIKVMASAALLSAIALPAQAVTDLTDINGSYAKDAIQELVNAGILNGKGDGKFDPSGKIERQDFAIILAKALGLELDQVPASTTFTDVPTSHYAFNYVEAAAKAGLITGYGNGVFGTGNSLSRQDMAVIFVRALGVDATGKGADLEFSDAGQIADYAKDAVAAAVELGLIAGAGNGQFNPTGTAERQAVALVASNFLKKSEEIKKQNEGGNPASPGDTPAPTQPDKPTTPTTPTTPSTPSTPSSGGSSGGGSSSPQPDTTAPTVTLVSSSPVTIGDTVVARSSESGTLYLISANYTPRTKSELDSLSSNRGVAAASANINTNIPTTGLATGDYRIFAVDAAGNVSAPSSGIELIEASSSLTLSLKSGAKIWLNSGATLLDRTSDSSSPNTRNMNNWIEITNGSTPLQIGNYLGSNCFTVVDSNNNPVANLVIDSSSDLLQWSEDPNNLGPIVIPVAAADEHSVASLDFTLWDNHGGNLGSVQVPIIFDKIKPTVTAATYTDGSITLTFSEDMPIEINAPSITLDYSAIGDFTDSEPFSSEAAYTVTVLNSKQFRIDLTPSAIAKLTSVGKFRILALAPNDYAGNPIDLNGGIQIPSI
ncbi:S-layer homology domain-containing protein [Paenibacillus rhizolycopersici]|uniref:S-layer homology domain-containing protein n=1 Tax=Paenibacillus rhizolycopersici TaxID=2780073 RepID=UPI003D292D58